MCLHDDASHHCTVTERGENRWTGRICYYGRYDIPSSRSMHNIVNSSYDDRVHVSARSDAWQVRSGDIYIVRRAQQHRSSLRTNPVDSKSAYRHTNIRQRIKHKRAAFCAATVRHQQLAQLSQPRSKWCCSALHKIQSARRDKQFKECGNYRHRAL